MQKELKGEQKAMELQTMSTQKQHSVKVSSLKLGALRKYFYLYLSSEEHKIHIVADRSWLEIQQSGTLPKDLKVFFKLLQK